MLLWVVLGLVVLSLLLGKLLQKFVPEEHLLRKKVVPYLLVVLSLSILTLSFYSHFDQGFALSILVGFVLGYFLKEDHVYVCLTVLSGNLAIASVAVVYGVARGLEDWMELWVIALFFLVYLPISVTYIIGLGAAALFASNVKTLTN